MNEFNETVQFNVDKEKVNEIRDILFYVYEALKEKGYNPVNQIVGYILSGDPTYITVTILQEVRLENLKEMNTRGNIKSYLEKN